MKRSVTVLLTMSLAGLMLGAATPARAQFSLGLAANYGAIAGPNTTSIVFNNSTYNGNVATDNPTTTAGGNYVKFSSGTINGNFDFVGTAQTNLGAGTLTGSKNSNVSAVATAYNTITNLSTSFAAAPSATTLATSGTVNASTGATNSGFGTTRFFTTTTGNFLGGALVINGSSSDYVVINVTATGNYNFNNGDALTLTGGITSDHVFVNFTQAAGIQGNTNGGALNAVLVGLNSEIHIDNSTVNGRVFGGDTAPFVLNSGFELNAPIIAAVPEPGPFVGAGVVTLIGLACTRHRRRRATA
jgi:hypothetical protein